MSLGTTTNILKITASKTTQAYYVCEIEDKEGNKATSNQCLLKTSKSLELNLLKISSLIQFWNVVHLEDEEIKNIVQELKPFLMSIVQTSPSTNSDRDEIKRHIAYLNSTNRNRFRAQVIITPGARHFDDETISNLVESLQAVIRPEQHKFPFMTTSYAIDVLFPEMIIKILMNKLQYTYKCAEEIAFSTSASMQTVKTHQKRAKQVEKERETAQNNQIRTLTQLIWKI